MTYDLAHDAPADDHFEALARASFARIPEPFAQHLSEIRVKIEDFADEETLRGLNIGSPWQLYGLYHGHPIGQQSIWSSGTMPPVITLYRMPLLREARDTGVSLAAVVNHVVVHEVGHHFGLSDADMEGLEAEA
jgi:predicted Zn-dependent protease with MMP-like domain